MESDDLGGAAALRPVTGRWTGPGWPDPAGTHAGDHAAGAVAALYSEHAVGLIRLAYLMLGDRAAAEDAVQDAFFGLYRHWDQLADPGRALGYGGVRWPGPHRWMRWAAPLAAAAVVAAVAVAAAVVAGSLALTRGLPAHRSPGQPAWPPPATMAPAGPDGIPLYYVALTTSGPAAQPDMPAARAVVRVTATGRVLATITPPRPYTAFNGVVAAYDDRTFVLAARGPVRPPAQPSPQGYSRAERFYLLHIDPGHPTAAGRVSLRALPASWVPAGAAAW